MTEPLSRIPTGLRYYFGEEARLRRGIEDQVMDVFAGWSYAEIAAPALDYYALFERGMGKHEARRAFRLVDTDGRMLALRPDVTSAVARASATLLAESERPLRLCYASSVFRQMPPSHTEWRRETTQLGCELIGAPPGPADLEVLFIALEALGKLRLPSYKITLSSAEVFNGIADDLGITADEREELRRIVDLKDGAEFEGFLARLRGGAVQKALAGLIRLAGTNSVLREARAILTNKRSLAALDWLDEVWRTIESAGVAEFFEIDLADVSGLDYYTGLVFKIYAAGASGRIGRGGRYDNLISNFGKAEPATGFVLDLCAIAETLSRTTSGDTQLTAERKAVNVTDPGATARFREALRLRALGQPVRIVI